MFLSSQKTQIIEPLSIEDSTGLYLSQLALDEDRRELTDEDISLVNRICKELGGLPLAITQVVGFMLNTSCNLEDIHEMLITRDYADAILHGAQEPVDSYYELTLSNVWEVTFSRFDKSTLDFLDIVGFLDPDAIIEELFKVSDDLCSANPGLSFLHKKTM
jgi:hypothetical protein